MKQVAETARAWDGPAEIVWGARDPVLGRALKRVQQTLPHARVTLTEGGHFLQEEVPDRIAEAIVRVVDASSGESAHKE